MKRIHLFISAYILIGYSTGFSQDPSPSPSVTPYPSPTPAVADPNATYIPPSPTPLPVDSPVLGQPITTSLAIYRKVAKVGLLEIDGAEITFPGVAAPVARSVNWQNGHIDVADIALDGTSSTTSWDISSLTNPYQPGAPLKKGYTNNQFQGGDDDGSDWIAPDLFPSEEPLTVITDQSSGTTVCLGSVFVDDANRIFFTPPWAQLVFAIPNDVFEIYSVTHLDNSGIIIAEWTKSGEDNYHVVQIDTSSWSIINDFTPDDSLNVQKMLTWVDDDNFLGRFTGHGFEEYSTISLSDTAVIATACSSNGTILKIQKGFVSMPAFSTR